MSGMSPRGPALDAAPAAGASPAPRRVFGKSAVCALGIIFAFASLVAEAAGDDLLSLYREAHVNNPTLRQAIANFQAVQEHKPEALAALLPNINVQASRARVHQKQAVNFGGDSASAGSTPSTFSTNTFFYDTVYSINLTQPIFDYSAYQALGQADAEVAQASAQLHAAEQNLIFTLAQSYFGVLAGRADLNFARSNVKAIDRQLQQAQQRFEVGLIAHTGVDEARATRDLAASQLIQAENELSNRLEAVRVVVGRQPTAVADLVRMPKLKRPQPAVEAPWQATAMEHNWQLIAARKAAEAAMANIEIQRGGHFPTLGLTASASHQGTGGAFGGNTNQQSIGIQGQLPLFQGFGVSSRVDEAQARYTQSREQLEGTRRSVSQDTANAYRAVLTSIRQVQALQQAVKSNKSGLAATEAGYQAGTRTIVEVLTAQSNLLSAERDYQQAQYNYLVNSLALKQAAGTLSPQDLQAVNSLLGSR